MHTKRKQTLLASAGLLTAVTLTLAACTPASFKPGPGAGAPTQAQPGTNGQAVSYTTIDGVAEINGVPLKNAEVKVFNALTEQAAVIAVGGGNVIAVGGGNLTQAQTVKTDANGNFSVQVAGLTTSSVARVEVSNGAQSMSAVMTGAGLTTVPGKSGYAVAQVASFRLTVNPTTTFQFHALRGILKLARQLKSGQTMDLSKAVADIQQTYTLVEKLLAITPDRVDAIVNAAEQRVAGAYATVLNKVAADAGIVDTLNAAATAAAKQAQELGLASNVSINKTDFVGVSINIAITPTTITIGDTVINIDTGTVVTPPSNEPSPVVPPEVVEVPTEEEADEQLGQWVINGNISPEMIVGLDSTTDTVANNEVWVKQAPNQGQIISMTLILPTGNLSSFPGAEGFMDDLSGTVMMGALTGGLTFVPDADGDDEVDGRVLLNGSTELARYRAVLTGTVLEATLTYTRNDPAIEITAGNEVKLSSAYSLTSKSGLSVVLAGTEGSARIKF